MRKILTSKKGEMYIEAVVTMIVVMVLLMFCLSVLRIASVRNIGDHIADQLLETAALYGGFGSEFDAKVEELTAKYSGFSFEVSYEADWYNSIYKRVQLGDSLSVTVSYDVSFGGFGSFITMPLTSVRTGASENYWRTDADAG